MEDEDGEEEEKEEEEKQQNEEEEEEDFDKRCRCIKGGRTTKASPWAPTPIAATDKELFLLWQRVVDSLVMLVRGVCLGILCPRSSWAAYAFHTARLPIVRPWWRHAPALQSGHAGEGDTKWRLPRLAVRPHFSVTEGED